MLALSFSFFIFFLPSFFALLFPSRFLRCLPRHDFYSPPATSSSSPPASTSAVEVPESYGRMRSSKGKDKNGNDRTKQSKEIQRQLFRFFGLFHVRFTNDLSLLAIDFSVLISPLLFHSCSKYSVVVSFIFFC